MSDHKHTPGGEHPDASHYRAVATALQSRVTDLEEQRDALRDALERLCVANDRGENALDLGNALLAAGRALALADGQEEA